MNILLACGAGLSTSILMKKMEKYCAAQGEELKINAVPVGNIVDNVDAFEKDYDCVLIGPQVSYRLDELKGMLSIPAAAIPSLDYAVGNADKIMAMAHKITGK
ncbi:PTS sugar transporter subunit IIB [uncultured Dubosiella sp.]|uniref:PTS sugar transporter subunit IIB n=1 Tax=uncultured Dubosiella sp. TaxID=1937011 RepID=UPI002730BB16|nr:PTS sugar transporter subunit IIB [uncultured Dubosiella sp.]